MVTKSLTQQNRPLRTHEEIAANIGTPDMADLHPLIVCAPHILGGHAHLKSSRVTVERVLRGVMRERAERPLTLSSGYELTDEQVRAALSFAIDVIGNVSRLYAEYGKTQNVASARHAHKSKSASFG